MKYLTSFGDNSMFFLIIIEDSIYLSLESNLTNDLITMVLLSNNKKYINWIHAVAQVPVDSPNTTTFLDFEVAGAWFTDSTRSDKDKYIKEYVAANEELSLASKKLIV